MSHPPSHNRFILPAGWTAPRGYANGVLSHGPLLHVGGQIGWDAQQNFTSEDFVPQFSVALSNVLAVVLAAGGSASDIVSMTIFVTDMAAYRQAGKQLGQVWKQHLGRHYPAMALVGVSELVEPRALVEISAVAALEAL